MSDLWDVGNMGCQKCEVSEYLVVGGEILSEIRTVEGIRVLEVYVLHQTKARSGLSEK